ncbi:hypothetical protein ACEPAH_4610 [Sanghuangporus vaninii]
MANRFYIGDSCDSSATTGNGQMSSQPSMQIAHLEPTRGLMAMSNDLFLEQIRPAANSMITSSSALDPNLHTDGYADSQAVMSGNPSSSLSGGLLASTVPVYPLGTSGLRHDWYPDSGPGEQLISASTYGYHPTTSSAVDASPLMPSAQESHSTVGGSQVVSGLPSSSDTYKSQDDPVDWMNYITWVTMDNDRKSGRFDYPT